jgi:hypothetical protein
MTVGLSSPPCSGDVGATKPEELRRRPPSPRSPLPERRAVGGSRFWALAGDSSDEEEDGEIQASCPVGDVSPRSGPATVTLGDFFEPAWQRVTAAAASVVSRRRQKLAPGGRGSWLLRSSALAPA